MEYLTRTDFNCLEIEYCQEENKKHSITTAVKSIDLHLFDNQIGLLTITTEKRGKMKKQTMILSFDTMILQEGCIRLILVMEKIILMPRNASQN